MFGGRYELKTFQRFTHVTFGAFAPLLRMRRNLYPYGLQELNLQRNVLGDEGVTALAQWLPSTLTSLNIRATGCADAGMIALAQVLPGAAVSDFLCGDNDLIGEAGWAALGVALPQLASLTALTASGCTGMGSAGVEALTAHLAAHGNPTVAGRAESLEILDLAGCEIGNGGLTRLVAVLPLCSALKTVAVLDAANQSEAERESFIESLLDVEVY